MPFSIIATIGRRNELGKNGQLVFSLPEDNAFFKTTTKNHPLLMGSNTFKSLPKLLDGHENFVLVRSLSDFFYGNMLPSHRQKGIDLSELQDPDVQAKVAQGDKATLDVLLAKLPSNLHVLTSLDDFIATLPSDIEVFVIGGGSVYAQLINRAEKIYLTEVAATDSEADVFFPNFLHSKFTKKVLDEGTSGDLYYQHVLYERKNHEHNSRRA